MKTRLQLFIFILLFALLNACSHSNAGSPQAVQDSGTLEVHYIDVGQADATLFEYNDDDQNYTFLYDTGDWKHNDVLAYLESKNVSFLDAIVISHPDADHIGQLADILQTYDVDEVWMTGNESNSKTFQQAMEAILDSEADYVEPRTGDIFELGPLQISVLYPEQLSGKANEEPLAMKVTYNQVSFLFTGDASQTEELTMIELNNNLEADILQLGHHGSNTSSAVEFLKAVQPSVAIYSAGKNNSYGHPHPNTIQRVKKAGAEIYGTADHGTITITTKGNDYQLTTEKTGKSKSKQENCININQATAKEMEKIIHIGEQRATAIVHLRPFSSLNELTRIDGIGSKTVTAIKKQGLACVKGD